MPDHHEVRPTDVFLRRLHAVLRLAKDRHIKDYQELIQLGGLGPRTMRALALVSEIIHGAPSRFDDPARFAFAHGGKDGHPHPVPLRIYDNTISALRKALSLARLDRTEKIQAFQRLDGSVHRLENLDEGPSLDSVIKNEWDHVREYGGRWVQTRKEGIKRKDGGRDSPPKQLSLL